MLKLGKITMMAALMTGVLGAVHAEAAEVAVKNGQKIAFLGDSITRQGAMPGGYVTLVIRGLEANGIKATAIPAGINRHNSDQMLARLEKDVLSKKPDWMTLSCGVNDVGHVPLDQYKVNITKIVEQCQAAGITVMIVTATMIKEDAAYGANVELAAYNAFLRELATGKKGRLADLNAARQAEIAKAGPNRAGNILTKDGIHMNPLGNQMMATGVLEAFGLDANQIAKARASWVEAGAQP